MVILCRLCLCVKVLFCVTERGVRALCSFASCWRESMCRFVMPFVHAFVCVCVCLLVRGCVHVCVSVPDLHDVRVSPIYITCVLRVSVHVRFVYTCVTVCMHAVCVFII